MNPAGTISVIIPTLNAADRLPSLVARLQEQTVTPAEILVVDSSSEDGTADVARALPGVTCKVIDRATFNHGVTRHEALMNTTGEFVCFVTDDAVPANNRFIENLLAPMEDPDVALVSGRQLPKADARRFEQLVRDSIGTEEIVPEVEIDSEIGFSQITPKFLRILKQFAPFGPENNVPIFVSHELVDTGNARIVGTNHLKFNAIPIAERTSPYPAIAFQQGEALSRMRTERFDLCYQVEENYWRGRTDIQLNVKDIRFVD